MIMIRATGVCDTLTHSAMGTKWFPHNKKFLGKFSGKNKKNISEIEDSKSYLARHLKKKNESR